MVSMNRDATAIDARQGHIPCNLASPDIPAQILELAGSFCSINKITYRSSLIRRTVSNL